MTNFSQRNMGFLFKVLFFLNKTRPLFSPPLFPWRLFSSAFFREDNRKKWSWSAKNRKDKIFKIFKFMFFFDCSKNSLLFLPKWGKVLVRKLERGALWKAGMEFCARGYFYIRQFSAYSSSKLSSAYFCWAQNFGRAFLFVVSAHFAQHEGGAYTFVVQMSF